MRYLVPILVLALASPVFAAEEDVVESAKEETVSETSQEDELLKDWLGLIKVLRSHGIHNSQVDWRPIEELCLGLKTTKDHVPYNRCRLDKAISQVNYRNDNNECNQTAKAEYPDRLLQYSPELLVTENELDEGTQEYGTNQLFRAPMNKRELNNKRSVIYRSCMRGLGWNDPYNWRMGRKD